MRPILWTHLLAGCWILALSAQAQPEVSTVDRAIAQLKSPEGRADLESGYAFYRLIQSQSASIYSRRDVAEIADLLNDKNGDVRYWTAVSLGYIGPGAVSASSALRGALQRATCSESHQKTGPRESFAIEGAMIKIGLEPQKIVCSRDQGHP